MAGTESATFEPAYLQLHRSGQLGQRVERALELLRSCRVCQRHCRVNRLDNKFAVCRTARYALVASYSPHHGEEDCLAQYHPAGKVTCSEFLEINRRVTPVEYERALDDAWHAGLKRLDSRTLA